MQKSFVDLVRTSHAECLDRVRIHKLTALHTITDLGTNVRLARGTAEETAQAIGDELSQMSGLTGVLVVALDSAGQAVPLARDLSVDIRVRVNSPIPAALMVGWAERVGAGPWVGP
jgi:hypothetical protein